MQRTSVSGGMSTRSFQSGLPSTFAYRSQTALTIAAVARWMTPFSGPSQRNCSSPASDRQNAAEVVDDRFERPPDDQWGQRTDGLDAQLIAPADREGQPVAGEPAGSSVRRMA